jgi:diacylglycerol kinase family enzyme
MMAGIGLDARAVETVSLPLKRRVGKLAYGVSILGAVARAPARAPITLSIAGSTSSAAWVVAAKGRHYAGGFIIAPHATLDRPDFEVCLCPAGGRLHAFRYVASLGLGVLGLNRDVRYVRVAALTVDGPLGMPVQADGEIVTHLPVALAVADTPLRVIAPTT